MDSKLVQIIKMNFGVKDTTELLDIWNNNDRKSYSDEAFEAVRLILTERGVTVPQQPVYVPVEENLNLRSKDSKELDKASETNYNPQTEAGQHVNKAYSYKERNEFEDVLLEADAAIKIDPSLAEAHNLRGIALEELGRPKEALAAYRRALDFAPSFREAEFNLSELVAELEATQQTRIIATPPLPTEANVVKDRMGRRKLLTILVSFVIVTAVIASVVTPLVPSHRSYTPSEAERYLNLALEAKQNGNYSAALSYLNQSIQFDSDNGYLYCGRGAFYYGLGEIDQALADFNQSILLDSKNAYFYQWRGMVYYNLSEMNLALADLDQAISLDPNHADWYIWRGMTYYGLSEMDQAIADFNRSLVLDHNNAHAYCYRGIAFYNLSEMDQALTDLNQSIQLRPDYPYAYYYRGMVYQSLGEEEQAIADFQMCLTLNPDEDIRQEVEGDLEEIGNK